MTEDATPAAQVWNEEHPEAPPVHYVTGSEWIDDVVANSRAAQTRSLHTEEPIRTAYYDHPGFGGSNGWVVQTYRDGHHVKRFDVPITGRVQSDVIAPGAD